MADRKADMEAGKKRVRQIVGPQRVSWPHGAPGLPLPHSAVRRDATSPHSRLSLLASRELHALHLGAS
jgi:hypothetical protein